MNFDKISKFLNRILYPNVSAERVEKDYSDSINVNTKLCSACKGKCCKRCGCHFSPEDFKEISFEFLKTEIEKGYISIDYFTSSFTHMNSGAYILRVRNQDSPIVDAIVLEMKPCILLTEKGCKLKYEERPSGGKLLIPKIEKIGLWKWERTCYSKYKISDCSREWMPYQEILKSLADYFRDKDFPCVL